MDTRLIDIRTKARDARSMWECSKSREDFVAWRKLEEEYHNLHNEIMVSLGLLLKNHTHPELVDKRLRKILANELLVLRRSLRGQGKSMRDADVLFAVNVVDAFARRIQDIERVGTEAIYKQNYVI
jgi:hypothetical protein